MAKIEISKQHRKSEAQVHELCEQLAKVLEQKYQLKYRWQDDCLQFKRSGISGQLTLRPGEVHITVKTGPMMSIFSSSIERELKQQLAEQLDD